MNPRSQCSYECVAVTLVLVSGAFSNTRFLQNSLPSLACLLGIIRRVAHGAVVGGDGDSAAAVVVCGCSSLRGGGRSRGWGRWQSWPPHPLQDLMLGT